jgi:phage terminase small subunit
MVETAAKSGFRQMSVLVQLRNRAMDQMIKLMSEFGLTPASRAKFTQVSAQLNLFSSNATNDQAKAPESKAAQYFTR